MERTVIQVQGNVRWSVRRARGGNWIAVCDALGLTVQSGTWTELMEDIGETLDAILKDLLSTGDLDRFLRQQGWQLADAIPEGAEDLHFDVPFVSLPANDPSPELRQ